MQHITRKCLKLILHDQSLLLKKMSILRMIMIIKCKAKGLLLNRLRKVVKHLVLIHINIKYPAKEISKLIMNSTNSEREIKMNYVNKTLIMRPLFLRNTLFRMLHLITARRRGHNSFSKRARRS